MGQEPDLSVFMDKVANDEKDKSFQLARLRRCWHATRGYCDNLSKVKPEQDHSELDDLLRDEELRDVKLQFWRRYKIRFPAEVMPADS